ncbi:MAG: class I SAM-dependent methyltransferase [Pseudomonadota bacterium]
MDKLNKELIAAKDRLTEIEEKITALNIESTYLQDKLHLYFDSPKYNTTDTEKHIISSFWSSAYKKYKDGGYITNDDYISEVRFAYEMQLINKIINEKCKKKLRAIDICCGNGRYTTEFAKKFDEIIGVDLSELRIKANNKENKNKRIDFINADFMSMSSSNIGTYDLVYVSDIFTYTDIENVEKIFKRLLNLVSKNGILLIRESTMLIGYEDYKSKNYVAYYRNSRFYRKGLFKSYFNKSFRNYAYNLYHLEKYFNVNKAAKERVRDKPELLKNIVKKSVNKNLRTCHFYVYKN